MAENAVFLDDPSSLIGGLDMRYAWLALAVGAIFVFAVVNRYEIAGVGSAPAIYKIDQWTGNVELCTATETRAPSCRAN
jgi:hypothetical protein